MAKHHPDLIFCRKQAGKLFFHHCGLNSFGISMVLFLQELLLDVYVKNVTVDV